MNVWLSLFLEYNGHLQRILSFLWISTITGWKNAFLKDQKWFYNQNYFFKETYEFLKKMMIQKGFWKHLTFPYKVTCIIQAKKFLIIVFLVRIAQLTIGLLHWIYLVGALDKSYGQNSSTHGLKALKKARPFIVLPVSSSASDDL